MSIGDHEEVVKACYDERWESYADVYKELIKKIENPNYVVKGSTLINQIHRAVIAHDYIRNNYTVGAKIIDAACGTGFNTCYLRKQGYDAVGFDFSEIGITKAKEFEASLGLSPSVFVVKDHTFFDGVKNNSVDVVLAMGFLTYVTDDVRDYLYRNIFRVLKKGGCFLVTNQNRIFGMFSLNEGMLRLWSEVIGEFSNAAELVAPNTVMDALRVKISLPVRHYSKQSVSQRIKAHEENPLIYGQMASRYGFVLHKIFYPDSHLLPPFLEQSVDNKRLDTLKAKVCLSRAEDWRAMFMCYEFLSVLVK